MTFFVRLHLGPVLPLAGGRQGVEDGPEEVDASGHQEHELPLFRSLKEFAASNFGKN